MRIPILQLEDILLASIQVDITDRDALDFQSDLLQTLSKTEARGVIIDITALDVVDSFIARVINDTANMARLLGAEIVISGMNPMVALTLIEMGRELIGVETSLNLAQGIEKLNRLIRERGPRL